MFPAGSREQNHWCQSLQLEGNNAVHSRDDLNLVEGKQLQGSSEPKICRYYTNTVNKISEHTEFLHAYTCAPLYKKWMCVILYCCNEKYFLDKKRKLRTI